MGDRNHETELARYEAVELEVAREEAAALKAKLAARRNDLRVEVATASSVAVCLCALASNAGLEASAFVAIVSAVGAAFGLLKIINRPPMRIE